MLLCLGSREACSVAESIQDQALYRTTPPEALLCHMQRSERQIFIRSGSITITSGIRSCHNQSDYDIEKCTKVCVHNYAATCATGFAQAMAAEEEASAAAAAAAAKNVP